MITLNINKMELPVFDVIQAVPFHIPLKEKFNLYFEIPCVNKYFEFEAKYLKVIQKYLVLFSDVYFLELKDFKELKLKQQFLKELKPAMQNEKFKAEIRKIVKKYFTADFKIRKLLDIINPMQMGYLIMFIHCIVENVKSFFFRGSGKAEPSDLGDFFFFFESVFGKNRAEILDMPITYAMLLVEKYNKEQRANEKAKPKIKIKGKQYGKSR